MALQLLPLVTLQDGIFSKKFQNVARICSSLSRAAPDRYKSLAVFQE
jgi:hypothetical protein